MVLGVSHDWVFQSLRSHEQWQIYLKFIKLNKSYTPGVNTFEIHNTYSTTTGTLFLFAEYLLFIVIDIGIVWTFIANHEVGMAHIVE